MDEMLRERAGSRQNDYEIVLLEELVPQDHLLRKIDAAVDFGFIHALCKDLYSPDTGHRTGAAVQAAVFRVSVWDSVRSEAGAGSE